MSTGESGLGMMWQEWKGEEFWMFRGIDSSGFWLFPKNW